MDKIDQNEFDQVVKEQLDEHSRTLDAATLSKLHQARSIAVSRAGARKLWHMPASWVGAGALAASVALVLLFANPAPPPLPSIYEDPVQQAVAEDMELMDDLEFIAWLMLEEEMAGETLPTVMDQT